MNIDVKDLEIPAIDIPNKSLFKMNEVCGLTSVKPYVLRFWESEFEQIDPITSSSGQKLYEHSDIQTIAMIKKLLFEDKLTVEEAKKELLLTMENAHKEEVIVEDKSESLNKKDLAQIMMAKQKLTELLDFSKQL